ncbi:aryl-phospho-beta-D-glucosidase BglC (GH1 family) [Hydrogenispora ethanolica]|jgi:aryl-phospho-beta-D-glucosidase BglC (GH1 family)|uniref:Aryl-phospho-beta-D-glucosidase BglC (GH1 family) n=1 Tax=Hydrogenispora ethanolica TaxID=1082276 RepID=A0A4R1R814_HYDET|nr:glycoside hydrolase family 5 protein [Hydrogenispora ethanolica]TCL61791.1 aryl-phospho-beta-D-glucosidase BglC (GH1 family) [Hydrogenispora ethanolica]
MEMLQAQGRQIVDSQGKPVQLRGTCIGGWMNMENFINGYPGSERGLREAVSKALGKGKGEFFFERLLDHFFNENDIKFIKESGANVVRIPLNYRHFEADDHPFVYQEAGFQRLDRVINWCQEQEIYVILDMHAVQGWQNPHWHSDNSKGVSLFWHHSQYQERFIALWAVLAERYKDRAVVAGYNLMNEPCVNTPDGDYPYNFFKNYVPDFERMNRIYRKAVTAIREIDSKHLIFLEGDKYSVLFQGLEAPFADNLVYSSHNYNTAGFGPGRYPGEFHTHSIDLDYQNGYWDRDRQAAVFKNCEGAQFAEKYNVPLWVGEFGSQYNGPQAELPDRLAAMDDQIGVFEEFGAHWTTWTYKDVGVMGWVTLDPESEYLQIIQKVQEKKKLFGAENFTDRTLVTEAKTRLSDFAGLLAKEIDCYPIHPVDNVNALSEIVLQGYAASLLQPVYANLFKGMSEERLDSLLSSFELKNCQVNQGLMKVIQKYTKP